MDPDQRRQRAAELRSAGHSLREIGRQLGVSHEQARADIAAAEPVSLSRSAPNGWPPDRPYTWRGEPRPRWATEAIERAARLRDG